MLKSSLSDRKELSNSQAAAISGENFAVRNGSKSYAPTWCHTSVACTPSGQFFPWLEIELVWSKQQSVSQVDVEVTDNSEALPLNNKR